MARNDIDSIIKESFIPHLLEVFKIFLGIDDGEPDKRKCVFQEEKYRVPWSVDYVEVMKRPNG